MDCLSVPKRYFRGALGASSVWFRAFQLVVVRVL